MGGTSMDTKQMDSEIGALILQIPDSPSFPSRELQVANAFIHEHPEYEKSRVEVYVSYVRVIEQMKKDGKLSTGNTGPASIFTRSAPSSKPSKEEKPNGKTSDPKPQSPAKETQPLASESARKIEPLKEYFVREVINLDLKKLLKEIPQGEMILRHPLKKKKMEAENQDGKKEEKLPEGKKEEKPPEVKKDEIGPDGKPKPAPKNQ